MNINVGDKLMVTKNVSGFFNEGDVVEVTNVNEKMISFACSNADTENHIRIARSGQMDIDTCNQYFMKLEEEKEEKIVAPTITDEHIAEIMENSEFEIHTVFDKCTIVSCRLPNGFVITESSACVSPENYDEDMGAEICFEKIADKIWELEGYRLQQWLYENSSCGDCENCPCGGEGCEDECEDEVEVDTDEVDCEHCDDYNCLSNPHRFS